MTGGQEVRQARLGVALEPARDLEPARPGTPRDLCEGQVTLEVGEEGRDPRAGGEIVGLEEVGVAVEAAHSHFDVDPDPARRRDEGGRGGPARPGLPAVRDVRAVAEPARELHLAAVPA